MAGDAEQQASTIRPPRIGEMVAVAVNTTTTAYAINTLALGGLALEAGAGTKKQIFLTIQADNCDIGWHLSPNNATSLNVNAALAVGTALSFGNNYGALLASGIAAEMWIDRIKDKYLVLQAKTGTGILRIWASSDPV